MPQSVALPLLLLAALARAAGVHAAPPAACERSSPPHTVALVELYTSEGCSSCPPADRWLSGLAARYGADRIVPLSLHVDYWDYIGWQDPYAQRQFGERQRELGRFATSPTIYTPEVFVGMRELRNWRDPVTFDRRLQEINRQPAGAEIRLAMRSVGARSLEATASFSLADGATGRSGLQGVLVLYEDRLSSSVQRGENRGALLQHDRVVRFWSPPLPLPPGKTAQSLRQTLPLAADWNPARLGLAAFVQDVRSGEVVQAVSLPACLASQH
jgi:hypothetical protein